MDIDTVISELIRDVIDQYRLDAKLAQMLFERILQILKESAGVSDQTREETET